MDELGSPGQVKHTRKAYSSTSKDRYLVRNTERLAL